MAAPHPVASTQRERFQRRLLPAPERATLGPEVAAAVPLALAPSLGPAQHHGGSTLQSLRLTVQRLPSPALRQQFIAQVSRQCGNAAIQRVLAADPIAVTAEIGRTPHQGEHRLPAAADLSWLRVQTGPTVGAISRITTVGADIGNTMRRRRIQRQCLGCEEPLPVPDQGTVRRTVTEQVQQRAPAPATEAAGDRREEAVEGERDPAPTAVEGICPVCGRRGTGTCACGQAFVPLQRQAIDRAPRRRHPWEPSKGQAPPHGGKPTQAPVQQGDSPAPVNATERATPENRRLAKVIDALVTDTKLKIPDLIKRRGQALTGATSTAGDEQRGHLNTLEAIEYLASQYDLKLPKLDYTKGKNSMRRDLRVSLAEGVQANGSFEKTMDQFRASPHERAIKPHLEVFQKERDDFASNFRGQAWLTTERMLTESRQAIDRVLMSYGLPVDSASIAAQEVAKGSSTVKDQAQHVISAATKSAGVDEQKKVRHRRDLADEVEVLKKHQQAVKTNWQAYEDMIRRRRNPKTFDPEEDLAARKALRVAWLTAEQLHPILATYRHGSDLGAVDPKVSEAEIDPLANVDLGTLDTDPVERQMQAVVAQLLPKMVDIGKAKGLLETKRDFALTLPSAVALTRTNMFIPKGSIRNGIVNDLASEAKDDSGFIQTLALALALITLIPSGGASLAIPAAAASIGLAVYSAGQEWQKYKTQKTLVNTNLDLARSLSTGEPSLMGFALSLAELGLEALPLVTAFKKARQIKNLANTGGDIKHAERALKAAVDDLNSYGRKHGTVGDLGDRARREIVADVAVARRQVREELHKKHALEARKLFHHYPEAATLPKDHLDEFLTWKKGLSDETHALFDANPQLWRNYANMDPRVRNVLTLCHSSCVPPFAVGTEQVARIRGLLEKHGLDESDETLVQFFHNQRSLNSLKEALDGIEKAKDVNDLYRRMLTSSFERTQARMKAKDPASLVRMIDETDEEYVKRLKELLGKGSDRLPRQKIQDRLEAAERRLQASQQSMSSARVGATIPTSDLPKLKGGKPVSSNDPAHMTESELNQLKDYFDARKSQGNYKSHADLIDKEIERRRIVNEDIKKAKETFKAQVKKRATSDEAIVTDILTNAREHVWVSSKQQAQRIFNILDEMTESGAVITKRPAAMAGDLPFRGPERHIGAEPGSSHSHYNAEIYYKGTRLNVHIYIPDK